MMETFVDPSRFVGTIYHAANWKLVGYTKGYRRIRNGYSDTCQTSKLVFVYPLQRNARLVLSGPLLPQQYVSGAPRMKLTAEQITWFFKKAELLESPEPLTQERICVLLNRIKNAQ
jgi:hypothetical protein